MVGATIAVLGVIVLLVAIFALRNPRKGGGSANAGNTAATHTVTRGASSPSSPPSSTGSSSHQSPKTSLHLGSTPPTSAKLKSVPLVVLNNTAEGGLAKRTAESYEQAGWQVSDTGNLPSDITDVISSCAYYDPDTADAKAAAESLQRDFPRIQRVAPRFSDLPDGPVVIVLNPDYPTG